MILEIPLRDYQQQMLDESRELYRRGIRRIIIESPTGSGKTRVGAAFIAGAVAKGKRVWWINHRRELIKQSFLTFAGFNIPCGILAAGFPHSPTAPVQVCSIQTLYRRHQRMLPPDLLIFDECFPAGTVVDGRPIEAISVGDYVQAYDPSTGHVSRKRVVRTIAKTAPDQMYRLRIGAHTLICTPNHKIWVENKQAWVTADHIDYGDMVIAITYQGVNNGSIPTADRSELQRMSETVPTLWKAGDGIQDGGPCLLHKGLLESVQITRIVSSDGRYQQEVRLRANENAESDAVRVGTGKTKDDTTGDGMETASPWRQRNRADRSATLVGFDSGMVSGITYIGREEKAGISNKLQGRHREQRTTDCHRDRWPQSRRDRAEEPGCQEDGILNVNRVDCIEILESRGDRTFGGLCSNGLVYNLEVEDLHSYTANGVVVSNCHHVPAKTFGQVAASYPDAAHLGLSATPCRLDGAPLSQYFDHIIEGPPTSELIQKKWLSPYKLFAPGKLDLSGLHTTAGDYNKKELADRMKQSSVCGDALAHYQKHVPGQRAVGFMWSVDASIEMAARFNQAGIPAAHIDGTTDDKTRDRAVELFRQGEIKFLTNVDIIGEGFDLPAVGAGFFLRPTQSLTIHLQQQGRVLRSDPDNPNKVAYLFDHAGNSRKLGLVDDDREWTLESEEDFRKKKKKDDLQDKTRTCPKCSRSYPLYVRVCEDCGFVLVQAREMDIDESAELAEVDQSIIRQERIREQARANDLQKLTELGRRRGYKHPEMWAKFVTKAREEKRVVRLLTKQHSQPESEIPSQWLF